MHVYYEVYRPKKKKTIILLHGAWSNGTIWRDYISYFKDYCIIVPDLRNHGRSGRGEISISAYAKDIERILKKEKRKAIVIGSCFGGTVAMHMKPSYIKQIIALNFFHPKTARFASFVKFLFWAGKLIIPSNLSWKPTFINYQKKRSHPIVQIWREMHRMHPYDFFQLGNIIMQNTKLSFKVPTQLIQGNQDYLNKRKAIDQLPATVKYINAGHQSIMCCSAAYIKELEKYL